MRGARRIAALERQIAFLMAQTVVRALERSQVGLAYADLDDGVWTTCAEVVRDELRRGVPADAVSHGIATWSPRATREAIRLLAGFVAVPEFPVPARR